MAVQAVSGAFRRIVPLSHFGYAFSPSNHPQHPSRCPLPRRSQAFARSLESAAASGAASSANSAVARLGASGVHSQYAECGYYFQAAASCALERRKCAQSLVAALSPASASCAAVAATPASVTAAAPASVSAAASPTLSLSTSLLIDGVPAPKVAAELGVSVDVSVSADSGLVIELLTRAYEHFKQSRQLRMILFLASQMGEEYFFAQVFDARVETCSLPTHNPAQSIHPSLIRYSLSPLLSPSLSPPPPLSSGWALQDYEMAKRFFERVAKTYQKEQWYTVLAHIQRCLRVCAIRLSLLNEFVLSSIVPDIAAAECPSMNQQTHTRRLSQSPLRRCSLVPGPSVRALVLSVRGRRDP